MGANMEELLELDDIIEKDDLIATPSEKPMSSQEEHAGLTNAELQLKFTCKTSHHASTLQVSALGKKINGNDRLSRLRSQKSCLISDRRPAILEIPPG